MKLIIFLTIITLIHQTFLFNLSPKFNIIFSDPLKQSSSYFGYSVQLRAGVDDFESSVVIGAPRANSTYSHHRHIKQPGAVYQCDINEINEPICNPLLLDPTGDIHGISNGNRFIHGKSNSWLGATLDGQDRRNGKFVTCAPRWVNKHHLFNYHPLCVGMCYLSSNTQYLNQTAQQIIPFLNNENDMDNFVGEVGLSLHMPRVDGSSILMGAVGLKYSKGGIVLVNIQKSYPSSIVYYSNNHYYTYFGYSVSSGKIYRNGDIVYFASAPRELDLKGRVHMLSLNKAKFKKHKNAFEGDQIGAYFGASLCVVDVNGDGLDDVLIGAPKYSLENTDGDGGRVYVYINKNTLNQNSEQTFEQQVIKQQKPSAEFGTSIASLGDLDKDGFNDVVIGAPYEDDGRGSVYIYLGNTEGLMSIPSQHIRARDIHSNLFGFGISVSRGLDIDNNFYNDLAVGSYQSGHVVLFRSHPVIQLTGTLPTTKEISLNTTEFKIKFCLEYTGKDVPSNVSVEIILNVDFAYKRALFDETKNEVLSNIISLQKDFQFCNETNILITGINQDLSIPIDLELNYKLQQSTDRSKFCSLCPVVNPLRKNSTRIQIAYITGCGDNICKPDLKITAISDPIIIGSKNRVYLNISLTNKAQDTAFKTQLFINMPNMLELVQIPENCNELDDHKFNCEFDKIFLNEVHSFTLELNTFKITNDLIPIQVSLQVKSAGVEQNPTDNNITIPLNLLTVLELRLMGKASVEQLRLDQKNTNKTVIHEYVTQNLGPTSIKNIMMEIYIPIIYNNNNIIFKVFEPKHGVCSASPGFNMNSENELMREGNNSIDNDVRMKRDTSEAETNIMKTLGLNDRNISKDSEYNINRTIFFNCSNQDQVTKCMIVKCTLALIEDSGTKASVKIAFEPQMDNIGKLLDDKDVLQVDIVTIVKPIIKTSNNFSGSMETLRLTIIRSSPDEDTPVGFLYLAAVLGIIFLILIAVGLWKYGFFKRNTKEKLALLQTDNDGNVTDVDFENVTINNPELESLQ